MKKKWLSAMAASAGMLALILDNRVAFAGAAKGVELCIKTVIPSLFPFLFLSGIISAAFQGVRLPMLRFPGMLFSLPKRMDYCLIPAFLGGYPIGAQCAFQACQSGLIQKAEAERMLAFCSNAGPAFIFGILSSGFRRKWLVWAVWGIQILSAWTAARLFSNFRPSQSEAAEVRTAAASNRQMETAILAMLKICGWVILFRVVAAFLDKWILLAVSTPWRVMMIGLLELSNGCCCLNLIQQESLRFIICNFILAFGGICVAYQTASVCPGLEMGYYYAGKLLQGMTAVLLSAAVYYRLWLIIPSWIAAIFLLSSGLQKKSRNPAALGV